MSTRFKFRLAGEADDGALRAVIRQTSMSGNISIAFVREPSFFTAERLGSIKQQTLICEDQETGKIVGVGDRSIRKVYVDGEPKAVGYLGSLRLLSEARGGTALVRGYRYLRDLHSDGEVSYYFTTILDENLAARQILESGRAGMPRYVPVGLFATYLIPLRKKRSMVSRMEVVRCNGELSQVHKCFQQWNGRHQFSPVYAVEEMTDSDLLPAFSTENLYVCKNRHEVIGTLAVWDQQSFKQTVVTGYSVGMKVVRPFYNGFAIMRGRPLLPQVGSNIRSVYACFVSSKDDNPEVFGSLAEKACADWSGRGYDYLLIGLSEESKLGAVARRLAVRELKSKVYLVHWQDEKVKLPTSQRTLHLEVATL